MYLIKTVGIIFVFMLSSAMILADDCPVMPTVDGGSVQPYFHEDIQLYEERIDIHLYDEYCEVFVDYTFINHGPSQSVIMGFPGDAINADDSPPSEYKVVNPLLSFTMTDNKENLPVKKRKGLVDNSLFSKFDEKKEVEWFFLCSELQFDKGEVKKIKNAYLQYYDDWECDPTFRKMKYILQTGKFWKDSIHSITVVIHNHTFQLPLEWEPRQEYDYQGSSKYETLYKVEVSPEKYVRQDNRIYFFFEDTDPDFDIIVHIPQKFVYSIEASSTLYVDSFDYSVQNIIDGDPTTAWVEGTDGSGINESVIIDFSARFKESIAFYKVDSIGILGGYAKSEDLFRDNNRIKVLGVSYMLTEYWPSGFYSESHYFTLEDVMSMQYIRLPRTVLTNVIKLTIVDIYQGDKYDDTCISEFDLRLHD